MLGDEVTIVDTFSPKLTQYLQYLHVSTHPAGEVARATHGTLINRLQQSIAVINPPLKERKRSNQLSASRVGMKVIPGYTGAAIGKPPALGY